MKRLVSFLVVLTVAHLLLGQVIPAANWKALGPITFPVNASGQINGMARATQIKFHPTNPAKIYVTTASGGLYVSNDTGNTWQRTNTEFLTLHKEASICINYNNDSILYLGTGDPNYYTWSPGGGAFMGVWKSTDAGATWFAANTGMGNRLVVEILMHPVYDDTLLAATSNGVYKTSNAGGTWTQKLNVPNLTDMAYKPLSGGRVVYATSYDSLYRSLDYGETWSTVSSGYSIPGGAGGQGLRIGTSIADSNVVYVGMIANRGVIFKSSDGGNSLVKMKDSFAVSLVGYDAVSGGQGDYNFDITVDPLNANNVYLAAHCVWRSLNSGATYSWQQLTVWYSMLHTDMHGIAFSPHLPTWIFNVNDGGVWLSKNAGVTWVPKSDGLSAMEITSGAAANSFVSKKMISIGTQDNGELYYDGTWKTNRGGDWYEDTYFDYTNPNVVYYRNGRRRPVTGSDQNMTLPFVNTYTAIEFSRTDANIAFVGRDTLVRTRNLSSNPPTWSRINIFTGVTIRDILYSSADSNRLWVITSNNRLYQSRNALAASPSFTFIATPNSTSTTAGMVQLPDAPNVLYMFNNNRIYKSVDTGTTWSSVVYNYPTALNINSIFYDEYTADQSIFIANAAAVYYRNDTMTSWQNYSTNLPTIANIQRIFAFNDGSDSSVLRAAFYGKGIWETPINTRKLPATKFGANQRVVCENSTINFYDSTANNPVAWNWTFEGGLPATSTLRNPIVTYATSGLYRVTLTATNAVGSKNKTVPAYITVTKSDTVPLQEGFEGASAIPVNWSLYDAGNDLVNWQKSTSVGGFGASTNSMVFDNWTNNVNGKVDELRTQKLRFAGYDSVWLAFDRAYAFYSATYPDSLAVKIATNCSDNYNTTLWLKGSAGLATAPNNTSTKFVPTATQWKRDTINLTAFKAQTAASISFQNLGRFGQALYIDNINLFGKKSPSAVLPVQLLFFTATKQDHLVVLKWATASEVNSAFFVVEKSNDAIHFFDLLRQDAAGTSNSTIYYSGVDGNPFSGVTYYRLKQFDNDGTIAFSQIVSVYFADVQGHSPVHVEPNPSTGVVYVTGLDETIAAKLFSSEGKMVAAYTIPAFQNVSISFQQLEAGVYFLKYYWQGELFTDRLVLIK